MVKVEVQTLKGEKSFFRGIVLQVTDNGFYLLPFGFDSNNVKGLYFSFKEVITLKTTRFPKEVSDLLKEAYSFYKEISGLEQQIEEFKKELEEKKGLQFANQFEMKNVIQKLRTKQNNLEKKMLFRMTLKRKLLLESVITRLTIKIEGINGLGRSIIDLIPNLSEEERQKKLNDNIQEEEKWKLVHDVLETVFAHDDDFMLNLHRMEKREWRNEWEIPEQVFSDAIKDTITLLTHHKERSVKEEHKKKYEKEIKFLKELNTFRIAG